MGPPSYMRFVVDRNVVMRRTTVHNACYPTSHTVPATDASSNRRINERERRNLVLQ